MNKEIYTVTIIWYGAEGSACTSAFSCRSQAETFYKKVQALTKDRDDVVVSFDSCSLNSESYLEDLKAELKEA